MLGPSLDMKVLLKSNISWAISLKSRYFLLDNFSTPLSFVQALSKAIQGPRFGSTRLSTIFRPTIFYLLFFSYTLFRPAFFVSHLFRTSFFRILIFRPCFFSSSFAHFRFVHFFVHAFCFVSSTFLPSTFSSMHFSVWLFLICSWTVKFRLPLCSLPNWNVSGRVKFCLCIFSSTQFFVHSCFRPDTYSSMFWPAHGWGAGIRPPPMFFADSEKRRRVAPPNLP